MIADKLLICIVLIWLLYVTATSLLFFIPSIAIITRELVISSLRQFFAESKINPIKVSFVAKSKTAVQITATSFWLISPNFGYNFEILTLFLIWLAAFISLYSLFDYVVSYLNLAK